MRPVAQRDVQEAMNYLLDVSAPVHSEYGQGYKGRKEITMTFTYGRLRRMFACAQRIAKSQGWELE